jgi:hypothetical protein
MDMFDIHIFKDGKPAGDLHPYLGALAHAVFLMEKTSATFTFIRWQWGKCPWLTWICTVPACLTMQSPHPT